MQRLPRFGMVNQATVIEHNGNIQFKTCNRLLGTFIGTCGGISKHKPPLDHAIELLPAIFGNTLLFREQRPV